MLTNLQKEMLRGPSAWPVSGVGMAAASCGSRKALVLSDLRSCHWFFAVSEEWVTQRPPPARLTGALHTHTVASP